MDPVLMATARGRAELVEVAKAALVEKTVRLPIDWPKGLKGEQPIAISAPDVEEPIHLLAKRAGGRVTDAGIRVRLRPADDAQADEIKRFCEGEGPAAEDPVEDAEVDEPSEPPPAEPSEPPAAEPSEPPAAEPSEPPAAAPSEPPAAEPSEAPAAAPSEAPSSRDDDVRTGETLPPPSMRASSATREGDTLPPAQMAVSRPSETSDSPPADEAEPEDDRSEDDRSEDDRSEDDRTEDDAPEISLRITSSIPPEFAEHVDAKAGADVASPVALFAAAQRLMAHVSVADRRMLVDAGSAGAMALCRARIKATVDTFGRSRFRDCMRELGEHAGHAILNSLEVALKAAAGDGESHALEDLLRAAPETEDVELARAVAPMCSYGKPRVRLAAISALPKLMGEGAKPMLRNALRDDDESVRRAAISGLRRVGGIDVLALHRLDPILMGEDDASDELRALVAAALVDVDVAQRDAALASLRDALNPRTSLVSLFIKADEANPMLVEAICKTMLIIGGPKERRMVSKHASRSQQSLRRRLESLLDRHS